MAFLFENGHSRRDIRKGNNCNILSRYIFQGNNIELFKWQWQSIVQLVKSQNRKLYKFNGKTQHNINSIFDLDIAIQAMFSLWLEVTTTVNTFFSYFLLSSKIFHICCLAFELFVSWLIFGTVFLCRNSHRIVDYFRCALHI